MFLHIFANFFYEIQIHFSRLFTFSLQSPIQISVFECKVFGSFLPFWHFRVNTAGLSRMDPLHKLLKFEYDSLQAGMRFFFNAVVRDSGLCPLLIRNLKVKRENLNFISSFSASLNSSEPSL